MIFKTYIFTFRLNIEFKSGKSVQLGINSVNLEDEDLYSCEITYLEPPESVSIRFKNIKMIHHFHNFFLRSATQQENFK